MKYVNIPDNQNRPLPFYLAMEEYLARIMTDDELWFMWIVDPTVIIGRNQILEKEVNVDYCRMNDIDIVRRKSGGGCVYADRNNVMFSYICRSNNVATTFDRYTARIVGMLKGLGLNAEATGRNDILVNGLKVSGNAFYHKTNRSIVHGTMLYDTDIYNMSHALRPPLDKLRVYGVESVRQRITTLKPLIRLSLAEFIDYARTKMSTGYDTISDRDIKNIEQLMLDYMNPQWLKGRNSGSATLHEQCRIEGVGTVELIATVKDVHVSDIHLYGDFFSIGNLTELYQKLTGVKYDRTSVERALADTDITRYIAALDNETFINLMF